MFKFKREKYYFVRGVRIYNGIEMSEFSRVFRSEEDDPVKEYERVAKMLEKESQGSAMIREFHEVS